MTAASSTVSIVAAVAANGVIGRDGGIPWRIPGDQQWFKAATTGHVLVMGRRTYDSIGRPLPGRTTIVVTRQPDWQPPGGLPEGLLVAGSVGAALGLARQLDEQVFVVGGERVYTGALAVADVLLISWVDATPVGDTYFPAVNWEDWREVSREAYEGWSLVRYERAETAM